MHLEASVGELWSSVVFGLPGDRGDVDRLLVLVDGQV